MKVCLQLRARTTSSASKQSKQIGHSLSIKISVTMPSFLWARAARIYLRQVLDESHSTYSYLLHQVSLVSWGYARATLDANSGYLDYLVDLSPLQCRQRPSVEQSIPALGDVAPVPQGNIVVHEEIKVPRALKQATGATQSFAWILS